MKKIFSFLILLAFIFVLASFSNQEKNLEFDLNTPVWEVLKSWGETASNHEVQNITPSMIEQGKELVFYGRTKNKNGKKSKLQSRHFKCISCHNVEQENKDFLTQNPQDRLEYSKANNIPFLQGTTLYGAVNRVSFYNGDYQKKYKGNPRIINSHKNLREAIQLCAVECAQGRPFKNWELESVLAYFWSLELKLKDLQLSKEEMTKLQTSDGNSQSINWLKGKYAQTAPATFGLSPKNAKKGYENIEGNPENGKLIYDLSCLHCHQNKKYSLYELDDNQMTFRHLKRHIPRYDRYSIYQVSRYGAPSSAGKRAYMPQYPLEKMTNQQLEDLRAYIDQRSK